MIKERQMNCGKKCKLLLLSIVCVCSLYFIYGYLSGGTTMSDEDLLKINRSGLFFDSSGAIKERVCDSNRVIGMEIADVLDGGTGHKAGLKRRDLIVSIDEESISSYDVNRRILKSKKRGDILTMKVLRKCEELTIQMSL